jgi:hypothetical protein
MEQNILNIIILTILIFLSFFLIIYYKYLLNKWFKTFNIEQYEKEDRIRLKKVIIFRQKLGTVLTIIGALFYVFKILKIF